MNTKFKSKVIFNLSLLFVFCLLPLSRPMTVNSEEVVLNPGYIEGTIEVGSETISQSDIIASSTGGEGFSGRTSIYPNASSGSYSLTVNVPAGTSIDYNVYANTFLDDHRDYIGFRPQTVTVNEFSTPIADFILQNPGFIKVNINVTGGTFSRAFLLAYPSSSTTVTSVSSTVDSASGDLTFPVEPGDNIRVWGSAYLDSGGSLALTQKYVNVAPGETVTVDYSITAPETGTGSIAGNMTFNGAGNLDRHQVYARGGHTFRSETFPANGPYALTDLSVGTNYMYAYSYFNNGDDTFTYPESSFSPTQRPTVSAETTTTVDISANAAFINGNVSITGPMTLADMTYASIAASGGVWGTPTYGGRSSDNINRTTGAYDLIVSEGGWHPSDFTFQFYNSDPSNYIYQRLNFTDNQSSSNPISVAAGETATRNFGFRTGTVTITFQVNGDGVPSGPRLTGSCQNRDEFDQLLSSYNLVSWGHYQADKETRVTFAGMEGTCSITAEATVDGSFTTFGKLTVDVVPGAQQVIDIGGPTLTVEFPEPDFITSNSSITVTGKATDDVEVTSVTVNGVATTLASTGNTADPNEVSFSATIALVGGPSEIVTVATDTSGNTSSDTRTVFRDEGPPVLAFTPADGATSGSTDVVVEGTATDDIGIESITVIGQLVTFLSTNNPDDPNEVSFSVNLILADGPNFIKVVATDTAGQSTSETHEIAVGNEPVEDDPPPVVEDDPQEEKPVEDDPVVSTFGKVTGGGFILDRNVKHSFGFNIHYDDNGNATMKGQLQFVAHGGNMNYHGNGVSSLEVTGNEAVFTGAGWLNGKEGYSYAVKVVDSVNPGRGQDTFSIKITSNSFTYEYSGDLAGGNITVHEMKPEVEKTKTTAKKGKGKKK
ncbi:MAG: hypothetical protein O6948_13220 [Deltaproteobacteria bacterium]|nr:hypothetical protein [Deltaproteobacteria bacterium]